MVTVEPMGRRLERLRKAKRMGMQELAEAVGKTRFWLRDMEIGRYQDIGFSDAEALAEQLGVPVLYLLRGEDAASDPPLGEALREALREVAVPGLGRPVPILNAVDASGLTDHGRQVEEIMVTDDLVGDARRPVAYAVVGDCLRGEYIVPGDTLVVDAANKLPREGEIVVARVNGVLTAKVFHRDEATGAIELRPGDPSLPPILISPDDELEIVGVYAAVLRTKRRK